MATAMSLAKTLKITINRYFGKLKSMAWKLKAEIDFVKTFFKFESSFVDKRVFCH